MKVNYISVSVTYETEEGDRKTLLKNASSFESAEEALGKLRRFIETDNYLL